MPYVNPQPKTINTYEPNGTGTYSITFEYELDTDVWVGVYDINKKKFERVLQDDAAYPWTLETATTIKFTNGDPGINVIIYRSTDINDPISEFYTGSAIRAQDLNDNFSQLLFAAQELTDQTSGLNGVNNDLQDQIDDINDIIQDLVGIEILKDVPALNAFVPTDLETPIQVLDSTDWSSALNVTGTPVGFLGDTDLRVNLRTSSLSPIEYVFISYVSANPDGRYVNRSGDDMTGNLTFDTDKIQLKTDGSAEFASAVKLGNYDSGDNTKTGSIFGPTGGITLRSDLKNTSPTFSIQGGTGTAGQEVVATIASDGSATFAGNILVSDASDGQAYIDRRGYVNNCRANGSDIVFKGGIGTDINSVDTKTEIKADGSATFAGSVTTEYLRVIANSAQTTGALVRLDGEVDRSIELLYDGGATFLNKDILLGKDTNGAGKLEVYRSNAASDNTAIRDVFVGGIGPSNARFLLQSDGSVYLSDVAINADVQTLSKIILRGDGSATFESEVQVRNLNANYRQGRTGSIFQGFDGAIDGDPANFTSQINSDGSAFFQGIVETKGGIKFPDGTLQTSAGGGGGGTVGSLQQVTTVGNNTTNDISIGTAAFRSFDKFKDLIEFIPAELIRNHADAIAAMDLDQAFSLEAIADQPFRTAIEGITRTTDGKINLNADGSATFAGQVYVEDRVVNSVTPLFKAQARFPDPSNPGVLWEGTAETTPTSFIYSDGSATFAGRVTGKRLDIKGGEGGSPETALAVYDSSDNENASITADGSATFAGNVVVNHSSASRAFIDGFGIYQTNTGGNNAISLLNDGSATFASTVKSGDSTFAALNPGYVVCQNAAADINTTYFRGRKNSSDYQFEVRGDGTTYIGGTLTGVVETSSPNISLNADGNASFAGDVGIGTNAPNAKLDVVKNSTGGIDAWRQIRIGNDTNDAYSGYIGYANPPGSAWSLTLESLDNGNPSNVLLAPSGGNVGIGALVPSARLHIESGELGVNVNDDNYFFRHESSRNGNSDQFQIYEVRREDATGVTGNWSSSDTVIRRNIDNSFGQHYINFRGSRDGLPLGLDLGLGAETTPAMTVTVANIGIGTLTPAYALDVVGRDTGVVGYTCRLRANADTRPVGLQFTNNSASKQYGIIVADDDQNIDVVPGNGGPVMRVRSNGDVFVDTNTAARANIVFSGSSGSATFAGGVVSQAEPYQGANIGSTIVGGNVRACQASGTDSVWLGYQLGNTSPTSNITASGNAIFDGQVEANGGIKFGDGTVQTTAGGGGTPSNMVTTNTTQTISGAKTFNQINFNGKDALRLITDGFSITRNSQSGDCGFGEGGMVVKFQDSGGNIKIGIRNDGPEAAIDCCAAIKANQYNNRNFRATFDGRLFTSEDGIDFKNQTRFHSDVIQEGSLFTRIVDLPVTAEINISDSERAAAIAIRAALRGFTFNGVRQFSIVKQSLLAAFTDNNLDITNYGIMSEITQASHEGFKDDDLNIDIDGLSAETYSAVNYQNLFAFVLAAGPDFSDIEARLTALENA